MMQQIPSWRIAVVGAEMSGMAVTPSTAKQNAESAVDAEDYGWAACFRGSLAATTTSQITPRKHVNPRWRHPVFDGFACFRGGISPFDRPASEPRKHANPIV